MGIREKRVQSRKRKLSQQRKQSKRGKQFGSGHIKNKGGDPVLLNFFANIFGLRLVDKDKYDNVISSFDKNTTALKEKGDEITALNTEISQLKTNLAESGLTREEEEILKTRMEETASQLTKALEDQKQLVSILDTKTSELTQKQSEIDRLVAKSTLDSSEKETLIQLQTEKEALLKELSATNTTLQSQIASKQQEIDNLTVADEEERQKLQSEKEELERQLSKVKEDLDTERANDSVKDRNAEINRRYVEMAFNTGTVVSLPITKEDKIVFNGNVLYKTPVGDSVKADDIKCGDLVLNADRSFTGFIKDSYLYVYPPPLTGRKSFEIGDVRHEFYFMKLPEYVLGVTENPDKHITLTTTERRVENNNLSRNVYATLDGSENRIWFDYNGKSRTALPLGTHEVYVYDTNKKLPYDGTKDQPLYVKNITIVEQTQTTHPSESYGEDDTPLGDMYQSDDRRVDM